MVAGLAAFALAAGVATTPAAADSGPGLGRDAWWYRALHIGAAQKQTTGEGVTVALIDSPVDPRVPELASADLVPVTNVCKPGSGPGAATGTGMIADHGSRMATYIVGSGKGTGPGGRGILGMAPGATLLLYADDASPAEGFQCNIDQQAANAAAIDDAVANGAEIINYSKGTDISSPMVTAAIDRAIAAGVIVVAAAGQTPPDTSVIYPAATPGVVATVAIDKNADPWEENVFGNREAFVIAAPGDDLPAAGFRGKTWTSTGTVSGTSESTALVSGGLALVMSRYPKATGNQILQHLIHYVGGDANKDLEYGYGIMSVTNMLANDPSRWPDVNPLLPAAGRGGSPEADQGTTAAGGSDAAALAASGPADDGGGVPGWVWVLAVVVFVVVLGGGAVVIRVMGRSRPATAGRTGVAP